MADNVTLPGTGAVIASDEVTDVTLGTVQTQFIKLMDGTLGSTNKLVVNSAGAISIAAPDVSSSTSFTAAAQTLNGAINGNSTAFVQITGTWAGTIVFEGTVDGTNYFSVNAVVPTTGALATSTTANGQWAVDVSGLSNFQCRHSVHTSGTAVVNLRLSARDALIGLDQPLPAGSNSIGSVTLNAGSNTIGVVKAAALGYTANPTAVANGVQQNLMLDKVGRLVTVSSHVRDMVGTQVTTLTTTTPTTVVTAAGASVFADITSLILSNGSTTATAATLSDGTTSYVFNLPAGGGLVSNFSPPLKATTANTAWTLTCGTAVSSVYCNIVYVKNL